MTDPTLDPAVQLPPPPWMTVVDDVAPCVTNPDLYQQLSDRLDQPRPDGRAAAVLDRYQSAATAGCVTCPRFVECLRDAVTGDVHGFAAATTEQQRRTLRAQLNITPARHIVTNRDVGRATVGDPVPYAILDAELDSHPDLPHTTIARRVGVAPRTVVRRRRALTDGTATPANKPAGLALDDDRLHAAWEDLYRVAPAATRAACAA